MRVISNHRGSVCSKISLFTTSSSEKREGSKPTSKEPIVDILYLTVTIRDNSDQIERIAPKRRAHTSLTKEKQRELNQLQGSATQGTIIPSLSSSLPTQPVPVTTVSDDEDEDISSEDEKSDAVSTFGDVLHVPVQTNVQPTVTTVTPPLSLSFTVTRVMPVTAMLRVNVTTDASVWCGAWPVGENINLQYLQMSSPGKYVHGTIT